MEGGEAEARLELQPHHCNKRGVVHGGVLSALLDTALGAAVIASIPKEWWCATTSLSVQFLEGVRSGVLTCTGRVLRRGKRVAFAGGEVRDEAGKLVASAQGSWHLWPYRPEVDRPAGGAFVTMRGSGDRIPVGKILAVGRNYAEHKKEMGVPDEAPPVIFFKPPTAIVHDGGAVRIPAGLGAVHHEVEVVAVIGKPGRAIAEKDAMDHVLGFAVGLDMTLRDVQNEAKKKGEPWDLAKGFDTSAPVSLVVPAGDVHLARGPVLSLEVNGVRKQEARTTSMIHSVASLVSFASRLVTLERGDLLFTGTPSGVGPVVPGDTLVAALEGAAALTVRVEVDSP
jgi:fumarylpyruvate hydrolase